MTYIRVIPRDLFNEADLLKCLGRLYIELETAGKHKARFDVEDVPSFDIRQNLGDGSISVVNLPFMIGRRRFYLFRPLNSRKPWPLMIERDDDVWRVFDDQGRLSTDFMELLRKP